MRYKHDCDKCKFLGEWFEYDLYFHPAEHGIETIVARSSDVPEDYISGIDLIRYFPALREAKRRAQEAGFLNKDPAH